MKFKAEIFSTFGENGLSSFGPGISQFQNEADVKTKLDAIADWFLGSFKSNIKYLYEQFCFQMCK